MKRNNLNFFATIILTFSLCGCSAIKNGEVKEAFAETTPQPSAVVQAPVVTPTPTPMATPSPTPKPTVTPTPEPTPTPSAESSQASVVPTMVNMPEKVVSPFPESYGKAVNADGTLSNKRMGWYFNRNSKHQPPTAQRDFDIKLFDGYYLGDIDEKVIYLTFDQGYENGYTAKILDTLKEKEVPAAFFLVRTYLRDNIPLVQRMIDEGHVVGNHSARHYNMPELSDEKVISEIVDMEAYYREVTGQEMDKFFRPPSGEYSARVLKIAQDLGYKTIFWSFAYKDWLVDEQPGKAYTYKMAMDNLHNGAIMLLHSVSSSNTEALGDIIDSYREQGFTFKSLDELINN